MPFCLSRRWPLRQLIAATSVVLLVACAEKPTAADAQPLKTVPAVPAPAIVPPVVPTGDNLVIAPTQTFAEWQAGFRKQALTAGIRADLFDRAFRSEEHTSELQSLMRISYAVFCLKKKKKSNNKK